MNERIFELAKNDLIRSEHTEFGWQECHYYKFDPDELQKFAELIVRECAEYAFSDDRERAAMLKHFKVQE